MTHPPTRRSHYTVGVLQRSDPTLRSRAGVRMIALSRREFTRAELLADSHASYSTVHLAIKQLVREGEILAVPGPTPRAAYRYQVLHPRSSPHAVAADGRSWTLRPEEWKTMAEVQRAILKTDGIFTIRKVADRLEGHRTQIGRAVDRLIAQGCVRELDRSKASGFARRFRVIVNQAPNLVHIPPRRGSQESVVSAARTMQGAYSIDDLREQTRAGRTTVYRAVDSMWRAGEIKRVKLRGVRGWLYVHPPERSSLPNHSSSSAMPGHSLAQLVPQSDD